MNWKPNLARCVVMSLGMTLVGCGSAEGPSNETTTQQSPAATNANLVTLNLPGMT